MQKIMFNDRFRLTDDVLEGRKTQTRRIITCPATYKGQYVAGFHVYRSVSGFFQVAPYDEEERDFDTFIRSRYKIGEVVAVAQSYKDIFSEFSQHPNPQLNICVRNPTDTSGWDNKMFIKACVMPHQIQITDIRVQRLQEISDEDCLSEGVVTVGPYIKGGIKYYYPCKYLKWCADKVGWGFVYHSPREAYAELIDRISGEGTWNENPFVFAYTYKLIK